jgi:hypothetical protein
MRVLVGVGAALVTACGSPVVHPPVTPQPSAALVEVDSPPPPARVETVPPRPSGVAVWIDGEWIWRRARWAWLEGRWVAPPSGGAFAPWVFVRGSDGRLWYAPGTWRDSQGAALPAPAALARASVEPSGVFDAEGNAVQTGPIVKERPSSSPTDVPSPVRPDGSGNGSSTDAK